MRDATHIVVTCELSCWQTCHQENESNISGTEILLWRNWEELVQNEIKEKLESVSRCLACNAEDYQSKMNYSECSL
jgi:hypothetical protein